ncbi:hypothetical protein [Bacillus sp. FJAT-25509]|nr:hypothetical protein [Bacillus sp. FJAT-25509]
MDSDKASKSSSLRRTSISSTIISSDISTTSILYDKSSAFT